jgi:hypothetical protein
MVVMAMSITMAQVTIPKGSAKKLKESKKATKHKLVPRARNIVSIESSDGVLLLSFDGVFVSPQKNVIISFRVHVGLRQKKSDVALVTRSIGTYIVVTLSGILNPVAHQDQEGIWKLLAGGENEGLCYHLVPQLRRNTEVFDRFRPVSFDLSAMSDITHNRDCKLSSMARWCYSMSTISDDVSLPHRRKRQLGSTQHRQFLLRSVAGWH